ncbi:MAG: threonine synthase [Verrucomicrobiales bacterium]|jgi:threonine synthase
MSFSIGQGNTPLIQARRIGEAVGLKQLWLKLEATNPSGSYKDRFAAAAVDGMLKAGQTECIATSSGNTGAALAACCAAAQIRCRIAVVEGAPDAKLQQMQAYGAEVFRVRQFGVSASVSNDVFERLKRLAEVPSAALQISAYSWSPIGMAGVESIGSEIARQLPEAKHIFAPAGGGGLAVATARGTEGVAIHVVQPEGNDTIAGPLRNGLDHAVEVECTSAISGLQVASIVDGHEAVRECRETGGTGHPVSDEWIWEVQQLLARDEGVFSEPAGAVSVAGALQAAANGELDPAEPVVCLVTGSGFKDAASIERMTASDSCRLIDASEI